LVAHSKLDIFYGQAIHANASFGAHNPTSQNSSIENCILSTVFAHGYHSQQAWNHQQDGKSSLTRKRKQILLDLNM
jgi:hypothetical protein